MQKLTLSMFDECTSLNQSSNLPPLPAAAGIIGGIDYHGSWPWWQVWLLSFLSVVMKLRARVAFPDFFLWLFQWVCKHLISCNKTLPGRNTYSDFCFPSLNMDRACFMLIALYIFLFIKCLFIIIAHFLSYWCLKLIFKIAMFHSFCATSFPSGFF